MIITPSSIGKAYTSSFSQHIKQITGWFTNNRSTQDEEDLKKKEKILAENAIKEPCKLQPPFVEPSYLEIAKASDLLLAQIQPKTKLEAKFLAAVEALIADSELMARVYSNPTVIDFVNGIGEVSSQNAIENGNSDSTPQQMLEDLDKKFAVLEKICREQMPGFPLYPLVNGRKQTTTVGSTIPNMPAAGEPGEVQQGITNPVLAVFAFFLMTVACATNKCSTLFERAWEYYQRRLATTQRQ